MLARSPGQLLGRADRQNKIYASGQHQRRQGRHVHCNCEMTLLVLKYGFH